MQEDSKGAKTPLLNKGKKGEQLHTPPPKRRDSQYVPFSPESEIVNNFKADLDVWFRTILSLESTQDQANQALTDFSVGFLKMLHTIGGVGGNVAAFGNMSEKRQVEIQELVSQKAQGIFQNPYLIKDYLAIKHRINNLSATSTVSPEDIKATGIKKEDVLACIKTNADLMQNPLRDVLESAYKAEVKIFINNTRNQPHTQAFVQQILDLEPYQALMKPEKKGTRPTYLGEHETAFVGLSLKILQDAQTNDDLPKAENFDYLHNLCSEISRLPFRQTTDMKQENFKKLHAFRNALIGRYCELIQALADDKKASTPDKIIQQFKTDCLATINNNLPNPGDLCPRIVLAIAGDSDKLLKSCLKAQQDEKATSNRTLKYLAEIQLSINRTFRRPSGMSNQTFVRFTALKTSLEGRCRILAENLGTRDKKRETQTPDEAIQIFQRDCLQSIKTALPGLQNYWPLLKNLAIVILAVGVGLAIGYLLAATTPMALGIGLGKVCDALLVGGVTGLAASATPIIYQRAKYGCLFFDKTKEVHAFKNELEKTTAPEPSVPRGYTEL